MVIEINETTITALLSLAVSLASFSLALVVQIIKSSRELEKRLTKLESSMITPEERKCLYDTKIKVDLLWNAIDFSKILIKDETPLFDAFLIDLSSNKKMNKSDINRMIDLTEDEMKKSIENNDKFRFAMLSFLKARLIYKLKEVDDVE